jgi:hypothetical protein
VIFDEGMQVQAGWCRFLQVCAGGVGLRLRRREGAEWIDERRRTWRTPFSAAPWRGCARPRGNWFLNSDLKFTDLRFQNSLISKFRISNTDNIPNITVIGKDYFCAGNILVEWVNSCFCLKRATKRDFIVQVEPENEMQLILDRIAAKFSVLRDAWKRKPERFDMDFSVAPELNEAALKQVEFEYQLSLPVEYRAFRLRFGDTTAGPGNVFYGLRYGLRANSHKPFPLDLPLLGECAPNFKELTGDDHLRARSEWDAVPKDHGVIEIDGYGCAIDAFLIVNGPYCGRVWIQQGDCYYYGPYGGYEVLDGADEVWAPKDPPKDYSFLDWYEHWLDLRLALLRWQESRSDGP